MAKLYTASHICRLVHDVDKITMHRRDFDRLNSRVEELEGIVEVMRKTEAKLRQALLEAK